VTARSWFERARPAAGAPGARLATIAREEWRAAATDLAAAGARLLSLWVSGDLPAAPAVLAAFVAEPGVLVLRCGLDPAGPGAAYPRIDDVFPAAGRLQRSAADLHGIRADGGDARPWLRHAAWRSDGAPLGPRTRAAESAPGAGGPLPVDDYPFLRVAGDGVHEIAVGPVHAGIIEPGHFRFSVVGEKVLRLEQRLGYVHKGIERRFETLALGEGHRLAARISGDSAAAFSWAYCQALEGLVAAQPPARAAALRALALELERIANHLGDLGALGNDAGFGFGLAQFSRLKEQVLRACERALGQRYLLDLVVPGGTARDLSADGRTIFEGLLEGLQAEVAELRTIYDEHAGLRDRFVGAGIVAPPLARRLGLAGLAGRASGQVFDLRADLPCAPYAELGVHKCGGDAGDVAARVAVRFDELAESMRLCRALLQRLPDGPHRCELPQAPATAFGLGVVEGWRGPVLIALESAPGGRIARCHAHDPSALNWPVLEHAVIGNIVPDFPLINKSFNLSYSGQDL
jgi:Ni,Fe-hydrogenase III large subunit